MRLQISENSSIHVLSIITIDRKYIVKDIRLNRSVASVKLIVNRSFLIGLPGRIATPWLVIRMEGEPAPGTALKMANPNTEPRRSATRVSEICIRYRYNGMDRVGKKRIRYVAVSTCLGSYANSESIIWFIIFMLYQIQKMILPPPLICLCILPIESPALIIICKMIVHFRPEGKVVQLHMLNHNVPRNVLHVRNFFQMTCLKVKRVAHCPVLKLAK